MGLNCGDEQSAVLANRRELRRCVPAEPRWLTQIHGVRVVQNEITTPDSPIEADAQVAEKTGQVCAILTADCLPVLFCNKSATRVAAAHAGWRGLSAGILENTVQAMGKPASQLMAWLGPAIGAAAYEVGEDVRSAFINGTDIDAAACFTHHGEKWLFDMSAMARLRLLRAGVGIVCGGAFCTYSEPGRFFSYRRDGVCGRMASLVWIE